MDQYVQWVVALAACVLFTIERLRPNHRSPLDWDWIKRAFMLTVIGVTVETISANALDSWLHSCRLFPSMSRDLAAWPAPISGLLGYLCVTFLVYWWHRLRHASSLCWRIFHQVHHSPARIEVLTTFYAHPADFVSNAAIVTAVTFALLGLGPLAAGWCLFWVGLFEIWEHTNIRTPVWLGYIIVRPEMHRVHHEYGIHAKNYGLPIWDILFGTYENSTRQVDRCGFDEDRERRLVSMLAARDVHLFGRGK